jgi:phosphoglycerol transferase MdoB-like AlkP superfamily enzyme
VKTFFRAFICCFFLFYIYRILFLLCFDDLLHDSMYWIFALRFDLQVTAYISVLPFLIVLTQQLTQTQQFYTHILTVYYWALSVLLIFCLVSDFFYFQFFNERLSKSIFLWIESPMMMLAVIQSNWKYLLTLPFLIAFPYLLMKFINIKHETTLFFNTFLRNITLFIMLIVLFIFIRGSLYGPVLQINGLIVENEYRKNISVFNPIRTFTESIFENDYLFFTNDEFKLIAKQFETEKCNIELPFGKKNLVLILVESLSSDILIHKEGNKFVMPFLNQLKDSSIYIPNLISSGSHTFNGIYSTLTGSYSLPGIHSLSKIGPEVDAFSYPKYFKTKGIQTSIVLSHDAKWDNVLGFFKNRGMDRFIDVNYFLPSDVINNFGVPDSRLLDMGIEQFNEYDRNNQRFFSTIVTISTHGPHISLDSKLDFNSKFSNVACGVYAYTDSSLNDFFQKAKTQKWFDETVFIISGDHGINLPFAHQNEIMAFHRVPAIVYYTGLMPKSFLFQTFSQTRILSLLSDTNIQMLDNSINTYHNYACFCTSNAMGCINNNEIVLINQKGDLIQFPYDENFIKPTKEKESKMINFAKYQLQKAYLEHQSFRINP